MKKAFSVFFLIITILGAGMFGLANADNTFAEEFIEHKCKSEILLDANSKTVIYAYNERERLPIASMCKIMTLLLCFEQESLCNLSFDEEIIVSENAAGMGGSQVFLEANAKYPVKELIKSITVASANDACVAMAERLCGSEALFIEKMNEKAKSLNMNDTVFVNCTGLPKAGQYSCAKDVSVMFGELLKYDKYFDFSTVWTSEILHPKNRITQISNTNKLIRFYDGCDGGKTGYTSEAGHCLAASAKRDEMRLISVVISAPDGKTRFKQVSDLFNYGFCNFVNKKIVDDLEPLDIPVKVENGKKENLSVVAESAYYLFSKKNESRALEINFVPYDKIKAPIEKGDAIGELSIFENGVEIGRVNVLANETVDRKTYFDVIKDVIKNWSIA